MATVDVGPDAYETWDKRNPIIRTATVTGAVGPTTYAWSFTSRPSGSTAQPVGTTSARVSFIPDKPGDYVLQCAIVNNGISSNDSAKITVRPTLWVRVDGVKKPATVRVKTQQPSIVTETVEELV
jgi:hypothetical protein